MADEEDNSTEEGSEVTAGTEENSGTSEVEAGTEESGGTDVEETGKDSNSEGVSEASDDPEGFKGSITVDGFDVPLSFSPSMVDYFEKQDVNIQAVLQSVSDNKGQLSSEMMAELSGKIAAPMLEMIINTHTGNVNDFIKGENDKKEAERVSDNARVLEMHKLAGDEAGWKNLVEWAQDENNVSDEVFAGFNTAMESKDLYIQTLAVKDMIARNNDSVGDSLSGLIQSDNSSAPIVTGGAMTSAQFAEVSKTPEYHADPAKYDAMRQKGINKGLR